MKNNQDIIDTIKNVLAEQLDRSVTSFHEAETFLENGCDEFDVIELIMSIEDKFDIALEDEIGAGMTIAGVAEMVSYATQKNKK